MESCYDTQTHGCHRLTLSLGEFDFLDICPYTTNAIIDICNMRPSPIFLTFVCEGKGKCEQMLLFFKQMLHHQTQYHLYFVQMLPIIYERYQV